MNSQKSFLSTLTQYVGYCRTGDSCSNEHLGAQVPIISSLSLLLLEYTVFTATSNCQLAVSKMTAGMMCLKEALLYAPTVSTRLSSQLPVTT